MPAKPKVAFYWCASCGGCEEAVVDLAEDLLGLVAEIDIVCWPVALDFKRSHVESLPDKAIAVTLLNGAIRTSEQEEMARLFRRKSECLIAYGACAQIGGIPGLANQFEREELLRFNYENAPSVVNESGTRPQEVTGADANALRLPGLFHVVRALDQVVEVDYYIPGCPPTPELTKAALGELLAGGRPPAGSVLAPDVAQCEQCPRRDSKPAELSFSEFRRPHLTAIDAATCLLAQGVVCLGPATRAGCGGACMGANMPCTGCFGPTSRVRDQGAKMLASLCANLAAKDEPAIDRALKGIPDPVGSFYRYALPKSLLRRRVDLAAPEIYHG